MAAINSAFEYAESLESIFGKENFLLRVPARNCSKADLLAALASAGHFPSYFGHNWDALQNFTGLRSCWQRSQSPPVVEAVGAVRRTIHLRLSNRRPRHRPP